MAKYLEILHLKRLGDSDRNIAQSCGVSVRGKVILQPQGKEFFT